MGKQNRFNFKYIKNNSIYRTEINDQSLPNDKYPQ